MLDSRVTSTNDSAGVTRSNARDGGGLSASELPPELIRAGDVIEYFCTAFVAGDPKGHCIARVLRVRQADVDFPLRVDAGEMLPTWILMKKRLNADNSAVTSSLWRKLRTYQLEDGSFDAPTRASALNKALRQIVKDAFASVPGRLRAVSSAAPAVATSVVAETEDGEDGEAGASSEEGKDEQHRDDQQAVVTNIERASAGLDDEEGQQHGIAQSTGMRIQDHVMDDTALVGTDATAAGNGVFKEEQVRLNELAREAFEAIPTYAEKKARRKQIKASRDPVGTLTPGPVGTRDDALQFAIRSGYTSSIRSRPSSSSSSSKPRK